MSQRESTVGFWSRQFGTNPTHGQLVFDILFGIAAPVICFVFDPIVFRGQFGFGGHGLLEDYQPFAYLVSALAIMCLLVWLGCGGQFRVSADLIAGVLLGGAGVSAVIGVVILPFSLIGISFMGLGIFGFIPFLTAFVYLRNGRRALLAERARSTGQPRIGLALIGFSLLFAVPVVSGLCVSMLVAKAVNTVLYGDGRSADLAAEQLHYLSFVSSADLDKLVQIFAAEQEPLRKQELKRRYRQITGKDIETRLAILND